MTPTEKLQIELGQAYAFIATNCVVYDSEIHFEIDGKMPEYECLSCGAYGFKYDEYGYVLEHIGECIVTKAERFLDDTR